MSTKDFFLAFFIGLACVLSICLMNTCSSRWNDTERKAHIWAADYSAQLELVQDALPEEEVKHLERILTNLRYAEDESEFEEWKDMFEQSFYFLNYDRSEKVFKLEKR